MHVDRISLAVTRIETAALRIREAARLQRSSTATETGGKDEALRKEAATALAELDDLIARLEA